MVSLSRFCQQLATVLRVVCAGFVCAFLIGLVGSPVRVSAQATKVEAKFRPALKARVAAMGGSETVRFSVILQPGSDFSALQTASKRERVRLRQQEIIEGVPASELEILHRYENLPGFSGRGGAAGIKALAAHPWVESVYIDGNVTATLAEGVPLVGADRADALGFGGSGVAVAVLDTGIDTDHPDLVDDLLEERCWCAGGSGPFSGCCPNGSDTMSGAGAAEDGGDHGTNVSGIVTSGGVVSAVGVAPDSGIVAIKVLSDAGGGSFSDMDIALDWLITNHAVYGVRVVNLSLGDGTEYADPLAFPCTGSVTTTAINDLVAAGVTVIAASGNDGYDGGIAFPACVPGAISVGGVYDANVGSISWCSPTGCTPALCVDSTTAPDQFVCHSNSSSALDILAPDWRTRTSTVGGGVANFGGTSAAAPYVSGLAALLIEQDPSRESADLLALMTGSAPLVLNPDNGLSFPRADVSTAFPECGDGVVEVGEECDDGNALAGDCCSATCFFEAAGSSCDDGDACTTSDQCDGFGACNQSTPVVCDDGQFCNGAETCDVALGCQAGTPPPLDDGVACTEDSCDEVSNAVVHVANASLCDDGEFCNGAETCDAALDCQAGTPPPLDDGVACTDDSCDEVGDAVVHVANASLCDDGEFCNGAETCDAALDCQAGTPPPLDDGVACTDDSCDEGSNAVVHAPDPGFCDDGDPCTAEACDSITGCSSSPIPGCAVPVPAAGPVAEILLILGLLAVGLRSAVERRG